MNPGLRRYKDYLLCAPFSGHSGEKALSKRYAELNLNAMALEADAVLHTGFGAHVEVPEECLRKARRRRREHIKLFCAVLLGLVIGIAIS